MTGPASEFAVPITRPEGGIVNLLRAVLGFETEPKYRKADKVSRAFHLQPQPIQTAIRKHWLFDHLPFYAAMVDLSMSEFERELAERFWADVEREAEQYRPRKRRQEVTGVTWKR